MDVYKIRITADRANNLYSVVVRVNGFVQLRRTGLPGRESARFEADNFIEKHKGNHGNATT